MKIAMLSWESLESHHVGGVGTHVSELAVALRRLGHDVHLFTRVSEGQPYYKLIDGVHHHRCPYTAAPDFVDDVNNMCRAFVDRVFVIEDMTGPFDLVHAHDWLTANAMIWIKQGRGRRCVLTIHSTEYARCGNAFPPGRSDRIRAQERAGTYWADGVICVSGATRDEILWMYEVPAWKTHVVHNGVVPSNFDRPVDVAAKRREYNVGPADPVVLYCGRLEWQKGPDIMLEAIPAVLKRHPTAKFLYVGEGSMRLGMERRAQHLGVGHAVRFLGRRGGQELAALYHVADGVCVPSRNEPFGIVILEAWSAGRPVVATDCGGAGEIVRHEVTGLRISPTPDSIRWGLDALLSDPVRAGRMGVNGRADVAARFMWGTIAEQTVEAYGLVAPRPEAAGPGSAPAKRANTAQASTTLDAAPAKEAPPAVPRRRSAKTAARARKESPIAI